MYWEYIDIIASNIPQKKIIAVSQWTARFNIRVSPKNAGVYLEISFALFDHKNFQQNSRTFQDYFQIPRLSRTFQDWWGPWNKKLDLLV